MSSLWKRLRVRWTVLRSRPAPGLRTAKATFAVVAAYLLTAALGVSDHPMVAPLVALLVVQLTLYKTIAHGIGKSSRCWPGYWWRWWSPTSWG
jgi:hypothetical protein